MIDDEQLWVEWMDGSRKVPGYPWATYDDVAQWQIAKDSGMTWREMSRKFGRHYYDMVRPMLAVKEEQGR